MIVYFVFDCFEFTWFVWGWVYLLGSLVVLVVLFVVGDTIVLAALLVRFGLIAVFV